jgi:hypothetical protein
MFFIFYLTTPSRNEGIKLSKIIKGGDCAWTQSILF